MSEQEKLNKLVITILANANIVRKVRLFANDGVKKAIDDSQFSEKDLYVLIQFAEMFMQGTDREEIFRKLRGSPNMREKLTNIRSLNW